MKLGRGENSIATTPPKLSIGADLQSHDKLGGIHDLSRGVLLSVFCIPNLTKLINLGLYVYEAFSRLGAA